MAATHLDTEFAGGCGQSIQRPVRGLTFVLGSEHAVGVGHQSSRWIFGYECDDLGALLLGYSRPAPGSGTISKSIYPFGVEAVEAPSESLWMAAKLLGDVGGAQSLPAQSG